MNPDQPPVGNIIAVCHVCDLPVADGAGYLYVDAAAAMARCDARQDEEYQGARAEATGVADLAAIPPVACWAVTHTGCTPEGVGDYEMEVTRVRTWDQVALFTADMMTKAWFADTDWDGVLRDLASGSVNGPLRHA